MKEKHSLRESVQNLVKGLDEETKGIVADVLFRIGFRPKWNYTHTIRNRKNTDKRLWSEVRKYVRKRHPKNVRKLSGIKKAIIHTIEEDAGWNHVLLCPKDDIPEKSRETYDYWTQFIIEIEAGLDMTSEEYVEYSISRLSSDEKKVLAAVKSCTKSVNYHPIDGAFKECVFSKYEILENTSLSENEYANTIIKAGLGDRTLGTLNFFRTSHLDGEYLINVASLSLASDSEGTHVSQPKVVYLVICPNCGVKNEQGIMKCKNCGAGL